MQINKPNNIKNAILIGLYKNGLIKIL